jgi:3'-phosphoadenosine 5'-phosphosulfate sulfotransferase (PAPS reductase)/FAD synthetase
VILVVSYGVGVDSTALLVALWLNGVRPDVILFADTGGERPETYAFLPIINAWLRSVGFPEVTIVRYEPARASYETLEGKCLANETLPSLAFGGHSCAQVFKHGPMDKWLKAWAPAIDSWSRGERVVKAIGYDNGTRDCQRRTKADRTVARYRVKHADEKAAAAAKGRARSDLSCEAARVDYWYPLQDWGIDRSDCEKLISDAGMPVPMKSSCFYCPANKKSEVVWLRDTHPVLFQRALAMEAGARDGKHGLGTTKGLGRSFAWSDLALVEADDVIDDAKETLRP